METVLWVFGSVLAVSLVSLVGIFSLYMGEKTVRKYVLFLVSLSTGVSLGDAFLHLLPEAFESEAIEPLVASVAALVGILGFLVLEKIVHWHHCHGKEDACEHESSFGIMNLVGDGIHNFLDGMLIAGSFLVSAPLGIATTIAVVFHELPQEISDFGVLLHAGFSKKKALFFNFLSALCAFGGAGLVLLLNNSILGLDSVLVAFTAGGFIYIAGTDLIPELHKETHWKKMLLQLVFIVLGMLLMYGLLFLE